MKPSENPQPNGSDPLEERLRRTTFRAPSPAWRDEIISAAAAAEQPQLRAITPVGSPTLIQHMAAWFRGIPTEWSAAAALWVIILTINSLASPSGSAGSSNSGSISIASAEQRDESIQQALAFRRQLLGELQGSDVIDDLPRPARPEIDRLKRQLNFLGTNGLAAASA